MSVSATELKDFFFDAALATYASGGESRETIRDLPGSRVYRYERDDLRYIDTYFVNGQSSGGQTLIYLGGVPVWIMQYHGWCQNDDSEVLRFLKVALSAAYERGEFHGGRGIPHMEANSASWLVYENWPQMPLYRPQDFTDFQGRERIWRKPDRTKDIFWHRYQGYLLEK